MRFYQEWLASRYDENRKINYESFKAEVPGNVQYDYAVFKGFGDIQFADNVKKFKEIEDYWWVYKTTLNFDKKENEKVWFVSEGIDYIFDIKLDGDVIFSSEGMFSKTELDITEKAKKGSILEVVIHPHPKRKGADECRDQADQSVKPPFCYGWDWNPRLLVSGIWRDAYIEIRDEFYVNRCEPFYELSEDLKTAEVEFKTDATAVVTYTVFDQEGNIVYKGTEPKFTLKDINLWWCNGQGKPYLYSWTAETKGHFLRGKIGFKTLRLVRNGGTENEPREFPKGRYAAPITVNLNGRRIFAQGSNWVNPELFTGRVTKERYQELIDLAVEANINILRIWGGSGINKPEFYELCDEKGILVWQEFPLACNNYVGTKHYLEVLEKEAVSIIKDLRSHPCLAFWCGGNELFNGWSKMDDQSEALRLLNKLCYEHDFGRSFMSTSPLIGMAHGGYTFRDFWTGADVFESFNNSKHTAYTEFGVPSISPVEQLKKIIPKNELFPIEETESWTIHHGFSAWVGDSWLCLSTLRYYFGEPKSLEDAVEKSWWLQEVGYKAIFEEARRKWPYCSMAINWCFTEPWITAANNTAISYPNVKKAGYFAMKESLRPVLASARIPHFVWGGGDCFSAELWLLNNSPEVAESKINAFIEIGNERFELVNWQTGEVEALTNKIGPSLNFVLPYVENCDCFYLKLETADGKYNSSYKLKYKYKKQEELKGILNV